jgi:Putative zinc-finger/Gram-negative bacterial TonB protein C-terminal
MTSAMTCRAVRHRFSEHRDRALDPAQSAAVSAHFESCPACASAWRAFNDDLDLLAALPGVESTGEIAARVFDRLDMEGRQPGLALIFRPFGAARPLMLPSLVPAVFVLMAVLTGALALDRATETPPLAPTVARAETWGAMSPPSGTESNPLFPTSEVSAPRMRSAETMPRYLLDHPGQGTVFLETVVARDGSVSAVNVLGGDSSLPLPVVEAMRRERYEPGRFRGRPVAVSIYRLISRMDVWGTT